MDSSGRYEALVDAMLEEFDFLVHSLSQALDKHGRLTALQVASHSNKRLILDRMYLFGRYQGIFQKSSSASPSSPPLPASPPSSPDKRLSMPSSPSYSSLMSKPTLGHYYPSPSKKQSPSSPPQAASVSYSLRPLFVKMQDELGICGLLGFDKLGTSYPFDNKLVGLVLFRDYGDFILEASMHKNNSDGEQATTPEDTVEGRDKVAAAAHHVLLRTHVLEDTRPYQFELLERCLGNVLVSCSTYKQCLVFDVTDEQQLNEIIALVRERKRRLLLGGGAEEDTQQLPPQEEQDIQLEIEEKDKVEEPQTQTHTHTHTHTKAAFTTTEQRWQQQDSSKKR